MKVITASEIEAARTENGGWTRKTLESWGVTWPPQKGWRRRLEGATRASQAIGEPKAQSEGSRASASLQD